MEVCSDEQAAKTEEKVPSRNDSKDKADSGEEANEKRALTVNHTFRIEHSLTLFWWEMVHLRLEEGIRAIDEEFTK